jgi:hypothetical protein
MNKRQIIASLNNIANSLDVSGLHKEASSLTNIMKRLAEDDTNFDPRQKDFPLDTYRAMGPARVDLSKYQEQEAPKYDYTKEQIVFDHLVPINSTFKNDSSKYGPDMTFDAFKLSKGRLKFQSNLVLNNAPSDKDDLFNDPEKLKQNTQPIRKY